jgi:hypothetical protein
MIKFETTEDNRQRISVVFDKYTDVELLDEYKNALASAIKAISQDDETRNTYGDCCYHLAGLLQEMEYTYEQQKNLALCERLNKQRVEKLHTVKYKQEYGELNKLTSEEKELKRLLFD